MLPESGIAVWLVPSGPESALLQQLMHRHPSPGAPHSFPHFHPHITLASISSSSSTRVAVPPTATAPPTAAAAGEDAPSHGTTASTHRDDSGSEPDPDPVVLLTLREAAPLGQRAIRVRFARVLAGNHYFRSIYVAIAPSPELAQLRAAFALGKAQVQAQGGGQQKRAAPGVGPDDPPAFPHLSLYYVVDEEAHTRARVLQELEREDVVRHSADGLSVALRCAGEGGGGGGSHGGGEGDGVLEGLTCTQIWIVDCGGPVEGWEVLDKILLAK